MATKPITEEVAEARESSVAAKELRTDGATVDVAMGVTDEEKLIASGEAVEEPTMDESREERLPTAAEQEVVVEMTLSTEVPPTQVDEAGPSGTVAFAVTKAIFESMQVPYDEPPRCCIFCRHNPRAFDSQFC